MAIKKYKRSSLNKKRRKIGGKFFTRLASFPRKELEKRKRNWRKKGYKYFRVIKGYTNYGEHWVSVPIYVLYGRKTK